MLLLRIHPKQIVRFRQRLRCAGTREIGGVLVGEHIGAGVFDLVDFSVQRAGGTTSCFVRDPDQHRRFLASFFEKTGHDYTRFNYLGEWHSHPLFAAAPSRTDLRTMQEMVEDPEQDALFAMLLIVRFDRRSQFETSATAFRDGSIPDPVEVIKVSRA